MSVEYLKQILRQNSPELEVYFKGEFQKHELVEPALIIKKQPDPNDVEVAPHDHRKRVQNHVDLPVDIAHEIVHRGHHHQTEEGHEIKSPRVDAVLKNNEEIDEGDIKQQVKTGQFEDIIEIHEEDHPEFHQKEQKVQPQNQDLIGRGPDAAIGNNPEDDIGGHRNRLDQANLVAPATFAQKKEFVEENPGS